jgi:hypothetical protein
MSEDAATIARLEQELIRTRNDAAALLGVAAAYHDQEEHIMNWADIIGRILQFAESEAGQKVIGAIATIAESHPNLLGDLIQHFVDQAKTANA